MSANLRSATSSNLSLGQSQGKKTSPATEQPSSSASAFIPLIDPTGFGGLIQVPVSKTLDTKGRTEYLKGLLKKEVSLCCLYQRCRCHAQDKCHQIHVDIAFMRAIRAQNANVVSCCRAHNDTHTLSPSSIVFWALHIAECPEVKITARDGSVLRTIPSDRLSITAALTQHVEDGGKATQIPVQSLCRLHLRGACKYGKDCKRIHFCCQLGEGILDESAKTLPVRAAPAVQAERPAVATRTPPPRSSAAASTPKNDFFSRASDVTPVRRSSVSSEGSCGGLSDSSVTASPPPLEVFQTPIPEVKKPAAPTKDELSFGAMDIMGNLSFMETSVKLQGLCFDPALLAQRDDDLWMPSCRSNRLEFDADCGASSTTSKASTIKRWTSPSTPAYENLWA